MKIFDLRKVVNLMDCYQLYETYLKSNLDEKKAYAEIAKIKTALLRFVLPEWGFFLKLNGNLSPAETTEGIKFMECIPVCQIAYALDVQERVFNRFGDHVSAASRRVYRSALKKMIEWGRSQDWWQQSIETASDSRTPTMLVVKKRVEHWHKLKSQEISSNLNQQLSSFSTYLTTWRQPCLSHSSCLRYRREALGILGWMHQVRGVALTDLSYPC